MPTYIKTGYWDKVIGNNPQQAKAPKGWFNLDKFVEDKIPPIPEPAYKVYTALFNQSGTNDPSINAVLQNTIGTFTVTRNNTGIYYFTSTAFNGFSSNNKVAILITNGNSLTGLYKAQYIPPINAVQVISTDTLGIVTDGLFSSATIEIRMYN
jgi:hypothetical protein